MLKLKELEFKGIGRFVESQKINIDNLGNLVQIDGENRNTGGSSGSGKSTVFNALDYLLGLNDLPTTVLQSRLTKDKLAVEGEFDWDGKAVTIARAAKLSITVDGQTIVGSSALAEEKLDEILGMPRKIFRKILHKRQKEGGFFLEFTPKEMYQFLTDALNLAAERKKLEKVELKLSELDKQKSSRQIAISNVQSSLKAMQEAILSLGLAPIKDIHQPVILELKGRYDESARKYQETEAQQKQETQILESERPKISVAAYDSSEKSRLEARRTELSVSRNIKIQQESSRISGLKNVLNEKALLKSDLQYQVRDGDTSKIQANELAGQVKKIRDTICPTCERPEWVHESAKLKEIEFLNKIAVCRDKIMAGENAKIKISQLDSDMLELHAMLIPKEDPEMVQINAELLNVEPLILAEKAKESVHLNQQNAANSSILQQFATKQAELLHKQSTAIDQIRGQADLDRRVFDAAMAKLKAYDESFKKYETTLAYMKTSETSYLKDLTENQISFDAISAEIEMAEELKKIVKTFISCAFDDALEVIGDAATKIIRCIPNMSNATIQFEGQKESKDGKVKEEVNAVISMNGEIGIPIKSLSGGERSSVDLAVDLAVIDLIETQTGKGTNIYIMDEPCTSLDTVNVEHVIEIIKNLGFNKKIIIVEHNPIIKEMVSDRIVVVREQEYSRIEL